MHGLNLEDCKNYNNTSQDAYIAGLCNFVPKPDNNYKNGDPKFLFINLSRCTDDIKTFGLIMHELMHQSFDVHNDDISKEQEIITWAELEAYKVFEIVKKKYLKNFKIFESENDLESQEAVKRGHDLEKSGVLHLKIFIFLS